MSHQVPPGFISEHFSWAEAFHTSHREIDNDWTEDGILLNIAKTAGHMEKVREILNCPITVSSWYRNPELNAAVGGAKNSDHMLGMAVDFICPAVGEPFAICKKLLEHKEELGFKQLILEHTWVHISWDANPNVIPKLEVLSLLAGGGYASGLTTKYGNPLA